MAVEIYVNKYGRTPQCVFVCNTSDEAFGPIMDGTYDEIAGFLSWLGRELGEDPRELDNREIDYYYDEYFNQEE